MIRVTGIDVNQVVSAGEWIGFFESVQKAVYRTQRNELRSYAALPVLSFHRNFAGSVKQYIKYPRTDYEMSLVKSRNEGILATFHDGLMPAQSAFVSKRALRLEYLSQLLPLTEPRIISVI